MANEIAFTAKISAAKNSVTVTNTVSTKTQTMATTATYLTHIAQDVGTSREVVSLGDVDNTNATGDEYILLLANRDSTNYVTVEVRTGASTYQSCGVMRPGEFWGPVRLSKLDSSGYGGIYVTANTAACEVEVVAAEAGDPAA